MRIRHGSYSLEKSFKIDIFLQKYLNLIFPLKVLEYEVKFIAVYEIFLYSEDLYGSM